ncbi:TIGR02302 family protein [Paracoccus alkenifer]|uniref:TIGR02302 family protein n=1 Tax=Paracoccus alkenifer TaxID=65735 RepID=A0A1H6JX66_9RHOB|nr:TIGR02302 family protein [Paracoccus alkenifer]
MPLPAPVRRAVGLTLAGLWWEHIAAGFWPAATWAALGLAALVLGLVALVPPGALGWGSALWLLVLAALVLWGWVRFRRPSRDQAVLLVDRRLEGRPLSVLGDRMVLGGPDAAMLWQAHQAAARAAAARARPVAPDAALVRRDPFALRLVGLTALAMALIFGGTAPVGQGLGALAAGWRPSAPTDQSVAAGPAWEGWAEPPRHTGRPVIYLNTLEGDALTVPQGTSFNLRLYGQGLSVAQDIGAADPQATPDVPRYTAQQDGTLTVDGRSFAVTVQPDAPPQLGLAALAGRRADGRLAQGFSAEDDHGITAGTASITLDLPAVDRRHGLTPDPEPREALQLDLPLPATGQRRRVSATLSADLSRHPWANLPVRMTLSVRDGIEQAAHTPPTALILPGRRFFDPLAAGIAEMRRDLLWSRDNAARSARLLRAMVWRSDRPLPPEAAQAITGAVQALESGPLSADVRDALADALWDAALLIEDGGLGDALERMRQAQQRLAEAIRNGASPDEIQKLMDALREATDDYKRMLAERGEDPSARFDRSEQQGRQITGDQIQQMMDEIQRLMNEGRMAEAQELLDQFNQLMDNLEVREGEGEGGDSSPQGRSMDRLRETLRDQQRLADDVLREAQRDPFGEAPGEGEDGGDGDAPSLADRQRDLRAEIGRQQGLLPGRGTDQGDAASDRLDDAGRAMAEAERALRQGDAAGALERQAEAIEALREGMRALSDLSRGQPGEDGAPQPGQGDEAGSQGTPRADGGEGFARPVPGRDPLGRDTGGQGGNVTTGEPLADSERRAGRARELQDEIRRRSGEGARPRAERDYLGRLLDRF